MIAALLLKLGVSAIADRLAIRGRQILAGPFGTGLALALGVAGLVVMASLAVHAAVAHIETRAAAAAESAMREKLAAAHIAGQRVQLQRQALSMHRRNQVAEDLIEKLRTSAETNRQLEERIAALTAKPGARSLVIPPDVAGVLNAKIEKFARPLR